MLLGRVKMKLAEELHDKVLYADAEMNKADWMTALGSFVGVAGIGIGWWWTDAVAALFISLSILSDGVKNMRSSILDLTDVRATTFDNAGAPSGDRRGRGLSARPGLGGRGRRPGPRRGTRVPRRVLRGAQAGRSRRWRPSTGARRECAELDWRTSDTVVVPVRELPPEIQPEIKLVDN